MNYDGGNTADRAAAPADDGPDIARAADRSPDLVRTWPLLVLALPAAVAVWSGWVGIGQMTGFGIVQPLPGIWDSLRIDTAVTLPVGVEAYAAMALRAWLTSSRVIGSRTRRFARWSAIGALGLGVAGQVAYHLLAEFHVTRAPWPVTTLVASLPVVVLAWGPRWRTCCGPMPSPRPRASRWSKARDRWSLLLVRRARLSRTGPAVRIRRAAWRTGRSASLRLVLLRKRWPGLGSGCRGGRCVRRGCTGLTPNSESWRD